MTLFYREDGYNGGYRIWLASWQGDQFEIFTFEEFEELRKQIKGKLASFLWLVQAED